MFSGIVQSKGKVTEFDGNLLKIESSQIAKENNISESISVNGACLTIVDKDLNSFSVNVVEETLKRTSLGKLSVNSNVNLEVDMTAKYIEKIIKNSQNLEKAN